MFSAIPGLSAKVSVELSETAVAVRFMDSGGAEIFGLIAAGVFLGSEPLEAAGGCVGVRFKEPENIPSSGSQDCGAGTAFTEVVGVGKVFCGSDVARIAGEEILPAVFDPEGPLNPEPPES